MPPSPTSSSIPAPGEAAMPAPNAAALLRANARDRRDRPAVRYEDRVWTHGEYYEESCRFARLFLERCPDGRPRHVGVLLDNLPEYLFALGGAALSGSTIVGINPTRRGEQLRRDIAHTDVALIVTEPSHEALLDPIVGDLPLVSPPLVLGSSLDDALAASASGDPGLEPDPSTVWALIFTSGTSDDPKAVICSQTRLLTSGSRLGMILEVGPDDVGYLAMPLFHSNSLMVGWAPSIVYGASVALAPRFSASGWLPDIRRYGVTYFNYTGKPLSYILATPERPDDADNALRAAFGNEGSPQVVEAFSRRFGVRVIDAFGATEGGIALTRTDDMKDGAMGLVGDSVKVVDEDGAELPRACFDHNSKLLNADECVGEIVNTAGAGPFEGYYNNDAANSRATRQGWYWSGDLGYVDDDGYLYFAGRTADWLRVDGENFPAGPIEAAVGRHPDVMLAAVYGVPDDQAGDQVMAALVLREGTVFDPEGFARWVDGQPDLGPKWRPRYVRVAVHGLPSTATNKVVKRVLVHHKFRSDRVDGDVVFVRGRGEDAYRPFVVDDEKALHDAFVTAGRERFWDL
jgi:fatty-acyl-CoA synthase